MSENLLVSGLDSIKFFINAINRDEYKLIHGADGFDVVMKNLCKYRELQKEGRVGNYICKSCVYNDCEKIEPIRLDLATKVDDTFFKQDEELNERIKKGDKNGIN